MRTRVIALAATTAVLAVVAAAAVSTFSRDAPPRERTAVDEREADRLIDGYRQGAVARLPAGIRYAGAARDFVACPGAPGRYTVSARYDLMPEVVAAGATAVTVLRDYWRHLGYRVVNETTGQTSQLLVEDPADGFRIGVSRRTAQFLRLAISSPCLTPATPPAALVLPEDLATAREAYGRYASGRLAELAAVVGTLRAAIARGDLSRARTAWRTALLCWDRVGAAYGTFGASADAIDGLPQGLPGGTTDPAFTGLHRVEYGLWHGDSRTRLLSFADRLGHDVRVLRAGLVPALPDARDLPLRVHEILEDAVRFDLEGLTDLGGGAGLAETAAAVDATTALLDVFRPLLDAQRPGLTSAARTALAALRQALRAARTGPAWPAPASLAPAERRRIEAALGAALEVLAQAPGLLETANS
jgi:hypothetical protein